MKCPRCGRENEEGKAVCYFCYAPLAGPGREAHERQAAQEAQQRPDTRTHFAQPPPKGGPSAVGRIIKYVIVAAIIAAGAWWVYSRYGGGPLELSGRIAFASSRDNPLVHDIYVLDAATRSVTRLTNARNSPGRPSFSPDGSMIALSKSKTISIMNADGSGLRRLTSGAGVDWHPDGSALVFNSERDGNEEIYVIGLDGRNLIRLTNDPAEDVQPSCSPDGTRITFVSNRDGNDEIYAMNIDGTDAVRLTNNSAWEYDPSWSPDGAKIAFMSSRKGQFNIYVMNPDGTNQRRLTRTGRGGDDWGPTWSPDGKYIAFRAYRRSYGIGNREIHVTDSEGRRQTRLTNDPRDDREPTWGP